MTMILDRNAVGVDPNGVLTATMMSQDLMYSMGQRYPLTQFIDDLMSGKVVMANLDKRLGFVARTEGMPDGDAVRTAVLEGLANDEGRQQLLDQVTPNVRKDMKLDFAITGKVFDSEV